MDNFIKDFLNSLGVEDFNPLIQTIVTQIIEDYFSSSYSSIYNVIKTSSLHDYMVRNGYINYGDSSLALLEEKLISCINAYNVEYVRSDVNDFGQNCDKLHTLIVKQGEKFYKASFLVDSYGDITYDTNQGSQLFHEVKRKTQTTTHFQTVYE